MHIGIVGTGLSGLATAWFLLNAGKDKKIKITFFDSLGIGRGTSGIAGGLMHPFAGASAKLNRLGMEGYLATCALLDHISKKKGSCLTSDPGLLRLAITDKQKKEYFQSCDKNKLLSWWDSEDIAKKIPGLSFHPGIFIKQSLSIDCPRYLEGLWEACEEKGAVLEKSKVESLAELKNFDHVVIATGSSANQLLPTPLTITEVRGQVLQLKWPKDIQPFPFAVSSHAYILMSKENESCFLGATYERGFKNLLPNIDFALEDIMPKALAIVPSLAQSAVLDCKVGVRASTPDHMPIIKQVDSNCWVITGMGSKGLLYHALYAERLAKMILAPLSMSHQIKQDI